MGFGKKFGLFIACVLGLVGQSVLALHVWNNCTNSQGLLGKCVLIHECPSLVAILNKSAATLENTDLPKGSYCGEEVDENLKVCCPNLLPEYPQCGVQLADRGGNELELREFPWAVLIEYQKANGHFVFDCGGSLINKLYVLTAAHCVTSLPNGWKVHRVRLSERHLRTDPGYDNFDQCNDHLIDMDIEKIVVHSGYFLKEKNRHNNIALIRMASEVSYSGSIKPICLPISSPAINISHIGLPSVTLGWRKTETRSSSKKIRGVEMKVMSLEECRPIYQRSEVFLESTEMCATGIQGSDTCSGLAGHPLMRMIDSGWYVIGVLLFGPAKYGTEGVPDIYTDVSKYTDWIRDNVYQDE